MSIIDVVFTLVYRLGNQVFCKLCQIYQNVSNAKGKATFSKYLYNNNM